MIIKTRETPIFIRSKFASTLPIVAGEPAKIAGTSPILAGTANRLHLFLYLSLTIAFKIELTTVVRMAPKNAAQKPVISNPGTRAEVNQ